MSPVLSFLLVFVVMFIFAMPVLGPLAIPLGLLFAFIIKKVSSGSKRPSKKTYQQNNSTNQNQSVQSNTINVQEPLEIEVNENQENAISEDDYDNNSETKTGSFDVSKVGIVICLIAVLPWPTPFYMLTRLGICVSAGLLAYQLYKAKPDDQQGLWVLLCGCAVLFNPIFPIYLHSQPLWMVLDILTAMLFFKAGNKISEFKKNTVEN